MTRRIIGDGGRTTAQGVDPPTSSTTFAAMDWSQEENISATKDGRSALNFQHSKSLPSTPYQRSHDRSAQSRSPSLARSTLNASPRSSHSDSNQSTLASRKPAGSCKYETGMAKARRRVPYSLGPEKLDPEPYPIKAHLSPAEDEKLSGDMRELYDRLIPSPESEERRKRFVQKLEKLLNEKWPGHSIKVNVFGSTGNNLGTTDSDVDICITTDWKELENVCLLAELFAKNGMERVVCVSSAKVPIVKIWDPELQMACDVNVNNPIALENTELIRAYVSLDDRVRPLAMIIKHWARRRILNDAALGRTLSSYTWICMIINFLQTRVPPVLPSLQQQSHLEPKILDGVNVAFDKNLDAYRNFGSENKSSLGELLFQFFRCYAHELDFEENVMSVRLGKTLPKTQKGWHLLQDNRLCVEEPFNISRNLGNTADDTSMRGIHLELRRAFGLVAEGKLEKCCEQYVPPQDEGKTSEIFVPPTTRPVVAQAPVQPVRAGRNSARGGKHANHLNRGPNPPGRRPSNPANRGTAYLRNMPIQMTPQELQLQAQHQQHLLHDRLFQQYQYLQAQEQELRMQLHQQALLQGRISSAATYSQVTPSTYSSQEDAYDEASSVRGGAVGRQSLSAPLHQQRFPYSSPYLTTVLPGTGITTNPPSPHLASVMPDTRRYSRRTSVTQSSSGGSLRAHSQPARSLPTSLAFSQPSQTTAESSETDQDGLSFGRRSSVSSSVHETHLGYITQRTSMSAALSDAGRRPPEYIGYYFGHSPALQTHSRSSAVSPIPPHIGLAIQNGGLTPRPFQDQIYPQAAAILPSEHLPFLTDGQVSQRGRPLVSSSDSVHDVSASQQSSAKQDTGPLIVNSSLASIGKRHEDADGPYHGDMTAFSASTSEDLAFDTPTSSDDQSQGLPEQVIPESEPHISFRPGEDFSLLKHDSRSYNADVAVHDADRQRNRASEIGREVARDSTMNANSISNGFMNTSVSLLTSADVKLSVHKFKDQLSPVKEVAASSPDREEEAQGANSVTTNTAGNKSKGKTKHERSRVSTAGISNQGSSPLSTKPNGHITATSATVAPTTSGSVQGWQTNKKKKKPKKAAKLENDIDTVNGSGGDFLPVDEALRKGG